MQRDAAGRTMKVEYKMSDENIMHMLEYVSSWQPSPVYFAPFSSSCRHSQM